MELDQPPVDNQPDIKALQAFAFNEPIVNTPNTPPAEGGQPPVTPDTPPATPPVDDTEIIEPNAFIKQHFNFEDLDSLKNEWATLQNLKNNPPKAEPTFTNDQSKKIYNAIVAGQTKEVRSYLEAQELLSNVETMNDEQKLKLFIKMNNPLYDQELIDLRFNKDYIFDEKPFKDDEGNITDPLGYRLAKVEALQKMQGDTGKANEFFTQYRTKIELPPITNTPISVDKDYQDYQASNAQSLEAYNNIIVPSLNALSENDVPLSFKVEDPNNQMNFDVALAIDKPDFDLAKKDALDFVGYVSKNFYDDKGNFKPNELVKAIALKKNFDKYAQSIARQAVNAERKRVIEKETPSNNGQRRDYGSPPTTIPQELKDLEKFVFPQ
jgi:hypothetical protein